MNNSRLPGLLFPLASQRHAGVPGIGFGSNASAEDHVIGDIFEKRSNKGSLFFIIAWYKSSHNTLQWLRCFSSDVFFPPLLLNQKINMHSGPDLLKVNEEMKSLWVTFFMNRIHACQPSSVCIKIRFCQHFIQCYAWWMITHTCTTCFCFYCSLVSKQSIVRCWVTNQCKLDLLLSPRKVNVFS